MTKAVILLIFGLYHGQPLAIQEGVYGSVAECRDKATLLMAGAMANQKQATALCYVTPWSAGRPT